MQWHKLTWLVTAHVLGPSSSYVRKMTLKPVLSRVERLKRCDIAYLLTTCSFQLFFGRLYTFFSIKWTFLTAVAIFELGSLICGAAPSSVALIIGRAIAGVGAAGVFSGGILIVAHTVPLEKRPIYTGFIGAMYGIASVAGPLMGGAFTDNLTWR